MAHIIKATCWRIWGSIIKVNISAFVGLSIQGKTESESLFLSAVGSKTGSTRHSGVTLTHILYVNLWEDLD